MIFTSGARPAPESSVVETNPILVAFRADWTQYRAAVGNFMPTVLLSWLDGPERINQALDGVNCDFIEDAAGDYESGTWVELNDGGLDKDTLIIDHAVRVLDRLHRVLAVA